MNSAALGLAEPLGSACPDLKSFVGHEDAVAQEEPQDAYEAEGRYEDDNEGEEEYESEPEDSCAGTGDRP